MDRSNNCIVNFNIGSNESNDRDLQLINSMILKVSLSRKYNPIDDTEYKRLIRFRRHYISDNESYSMQCV